MPCVRSFVLVSCTVQCTGDMPLRVAPCSRTRPMASVRRRPSQGFFLSRSIVPSPLQLLLTIAHNCCPHVLCAISRCSLVRLEESASLCGPPAARCRPAEAAAAGVCRLASRIFVDGRSVVHLLSTPHPFNLLIHLKPPLIRSPQITVLADVSWHYSITLFSGWFLGKHSAWSAR